ncbi:hypothetical protein [Mobiluncus mulieris]|nr:hypothetical protein [Mobiluncus mulieris]
MSKQTKTVIEYYPDGQVKSEEWWQYRNMSLEKLSRLCSTGYDS